MNIKNIKFDPETGEFIKQEKIKITESNDVQDIINSINYELFKIVQQVKGLKKRAEELKTMKEVLLKEVEQDDSTSNTEPESESEPESETEATPEKETQVSIDQSTGSD